MFRLTLKLTYVKPMSKEIPLEKIQEKFRNFAITNQHNLGIIFFRKLLKNRELAKNKRLQLNMAFLLYHQALKFYLKDNLSISVKKRTLGQLEEAIKICKEIIHSKHRAIDKKIILSARIYLAQIYACMNNPEAIVMAKENFKQEPHAVTANRLADIYMRLGDKRSAGIWYKKYEKLAIKEKVPSYHTATDMAIFYNQIGKNELAQKYLKKALANLPESKEGKSRLSIIKKYFDI